MRYLQALIKKARRLPAGKIINIGVLTFMTNGPGRPLTLIRTEAQLEKCLEEGCEWV